MASMTRLYHFPKCSIVRRRVLQKSFRLAFCNGYCVKKQQSSEDDIDPPIKFSTSKAANWKARYSFGVPENYDDSRNPSPWFESLVVRLSVITLLVYFCILREESDIDIELGKNSMERFREIQEQNSKM